MVQNFLKKFKKIKKNNKKHNIYIKKYEKI